MCCCSEGLCSWLQLWGRGWGLDQWRLQSPAHSVKTCSHLLGPSRSIPYSTDAARGLFFAPATVAAADAIIAALGGRLGAAGAGFVGLHLRIEEDWRIWHGKRNRPVNDEVWRGWAGCVAGRLCRRRSRVCVFVELCMGG